MEGEAEGEVAGEAEGETEQVTERVYAHKLILALSSPTCAVMIGSAMASASRNPNPFVGATPLTSESRGGSQ